MKQRFTRKICLSCVVLLVMGMSGCGWWKDIREWWRPPDMARATPEALYKRGAELYQEGRYRRAIEMFQRLKEQYPLHSLVVSAEIGIADSYFSDENYAEAEMAYRDFINLRPTNENLPYVMFQLGMCHYNQMGAVDQDQTETVKALREFERLLARFPDSKFSALAERYILECRKRLADKEFYIGNFYFIQGKYRAALGRFETIAREYPGIGLDYKVRYFIDEAKRRLIEQETKEKSRKEKEERRARAQEERAAAKKKNDPAVKAAEGRPEAEK